MGDLQSHESSYNYSLIKGDNDLNGFNGSDAIMHFAFLYGDYLNYIGI